MGYDLPNWTGYVLLAIFLGSVIFALVLAGPKTYWHPWTLQAATAKQTEARLFINSHFNDLASSAISFSQSYQYLTNVQSTDEITAKPYILQNIEIFITMNLL